MVVLCVCGNGFLVFSLGVDCILVGVLYFFTGCCVV